MTLVIRASTLVKFTILLFVTGFLLGLSTGILTDGPVDDDTSRLAWWIMPEAFDNVRGMAIPSPLEELS